MKIIHWIACFSTFSGAFIVIIASVSLLLGKAIFGFNHIVNFFHAANSFLLLAIALFIYSRCGSGITEENINRSGRETGQSA